MTSAAGYNTLHYTCGAGRSKDLSSATENLTTRLKLLQLLVQNTENVDVRGGEDDQTALHLLARTSDSLLLFDILLNSGADINAVDKKGMTPLNYALQSGHLAIAETLVVDPRMQTIVKLGSPQDQCSRNALVDACGLAKGYQESDADSSSSVDRLLTVDHDLLVLLLEKTLMVDPALETLNQSSASSLSQVAEPLARSQEVDSRLYASALCAATNSGNLDAMALLLSEPAIDINIQVSLCKFCFM